MSGLFTLGFLAYVCATGFALAYLIQRDELTHRLAVGAALFGWVFQGLGLAARGAELRHPPLETLPDAMSVAGWVTLGVALWVERRAGLKVLGAFVLPVVLVLSASAVARPLGLDPVGRALSGAWVWVHIALALVGIAAFALNFAGAVMYLLQERQLKGKRPGAFYYRLPSLETLDRLTYRTLALGFPFLTTALVLGALWAGTAWGTLWAPDPLAMFSLLAWAVYAATLAGRAAGGWHGRRAAYLAVVGFAALVVTLGAGLFLPGRHGS